MNVLNEVKTSVKKAIADAVVSAGIVDIKQLPAVTLEVPKDKAHGDFATNIAMQLTRIAKQNPRQIAEKLIAHLDKEAAYIDEVEIAGPGFINFRMNKSYLYQVIGQVLEQGNSYGKINMGKGKRVQVEFVSANPTGSLHLGHARGAAVGDALCNVLEMAGCEVTREYYINDAGNQVLNLAKSIEARYRQALGQEAEMPEDGYYGEDIKGFAEELAKAEGDRLLALNDEERLVFFRKYGLEKELDKIKRDLGRFGVKFDEWFSETSIYENNMIDDVLKQLKDNGHVFEQDGATWLRTTDYGDDKDRVLIKNDGTYTYLTPDVAYHRNKYERGYDEIINIWGADHHGYIPRMKAAVTALGYDANKLTVLIAQMVSLFQNGEKVKMSKRTGKAVTMEDLMDEVGVDAIRYFFTMRSMDSHLDFDMDLAISKSNENPVFYVQYAHARICSIFRQAEEQGISMLPAGQADLSRLTAEAEFDLLRKMAELPEEVAIAAEQYAPHRLIRYVYELASQFHSYYKAERVITDDAAQTQARLTLLAALRVVLRNVLAAVGVSVPERM
ncbi:arginine--tRNA ligase [Paenibacillus larvae subsp. larvae]|uniref:Arginine--tRNA ligase n=1 Tax=Paenibacillus larvae subsp. larvae TaxID=147375 RepID=A0A2L1UJJ7_9BACL|nr:arginine--tRNA ligase [Paenibacillus larvae]AQT84839.1 arginine--tRNA ligase [Paenibacillus larvae subsp. pulvifaciens]AQZ46836.1 arginine--tRNA ligase [Paenibacillus larvae subsp. pulvifaciens]AVF28597.1 arginine--tRNA ligase [Paenibacillus larvae subsp. larvae]AVF33102.1 arginine--tRNA ligase [Paenibacillus larvae subsp. larvae]MBH0344501.1 arginine--tRNA ligase [Paenibacillus larvae]